MGSAESWAACEANLAITLLENGLGPSPPHVNEPIAFMLRNSVLDAGPADPVDAVVTGTLGASARCTIAPTETSIPVPDLGSQPVEVEIAVSLTCTAPGSTSSTARNS